MLSKLRSRLTYANLMATIAVFVALGGTSYGVATGSIGSREIKNNSIRSKDVHDNQLRSRDVRNFSLLSKDFKPGQLPSGPTGATGPTGPRGPQGSTGISGLERVVGSSSFDSDSSKLAFAECPAGKQVISGGYDVTGGKTGNPPDEKLDIVTDNIGLPAPDPTSQHQDVTVTGYEVTGTAQNWSIQAIALCANVSP